jgi:hypothetical protein
MSEEKFFPVVYAPKVIPCEMVSAGKSVDILIPAKAYMVSLSRRFFANGTSDSTYNVVFSWDKENENVSPNFDFKGRKTFCLNSTMVKETFENYSICNEFVNKENIETLIKLFRENHENKKVIENEFLEKQKNLAVLALDKYLHEEKVKANSETQPEKDDEEQLTLF